MLSGLRVAFGLGLFAASALVLHAQEPSGVVGYIAFVDPATGERWIPKGEGGTVRGYPREIAVIFRNRADNREHRVAIENWAGNMTFADSVKYEITFTGTPIDTPPIWLRRTGEGGGPMQVQVNFERWRFDRVEAGPWRMFEGGRETTVPLTRRASPFPGLR